MKQFIKELISRLEERSKEYNSGVRLHGKPEEMLTYEAIEIINELAEEYKGGWIPCSVGMPKDFEYVYATCVSLIDDREPWVIEGYYRSLTGWDAMSPMLSYGEAKVVAWMPHKLPAPYQQKGN